MTRPIKFRAWDKRPRHRYGIQSPNMRYDVERTYDCEAGGFFGELIDNNDVILMQFTGLLDKNGKEIYEGDIVKGIEPDYRQDVIGEVQYVGLAFCFIGKGADGSKWGETITVDLKKYNKIEVIGNIYEAPTT